MTEFDFPIETSIEQDPPPAKTNSKSLFGSSPKKPARGRGRPSNASKEKDLGSDIKAFLELALLPVKVWDPICYEAWHEAVPKITDAAIPIIMENPQILEWMNKGGNAAMYIKLAVALTPPAMVTVNHHLRKPKELDYDESGNGSVV